FFVHYSTQLSCSLPSFPLQYAHVRYTVPMVTPLKREGKVQLAHFILVALGDGAVNACVETEGVTGRTLLMCAAELTHSSTRTSFMQLLLRLGVDIERRDEAGRTALSLASQHGYLDAVRLLVLSGAQTDTPDNEGKRPFDYATQEHHVFT
uniref:Uncharacterized protein n=1 Tax=Sinocyclocheilus anshuiensis TaxID=1608454 RepID=A0A671MLK0_9TELE